MRLKQHKSLNGISEAQVIKFPQPVEQTFSTKMADSFPSLRRRITETKAQFLSENKI